MLSSTKNEVLVIDEVSEAHGIDESQTRFSMPLQAFIYLLENKQEVLKFGE